MELKRKLKVDTNTSRLAAELNTRLVTDRSIRIGSASITRPKTSVARPPSASTVTSVSVQPKTSGTKYVIIGSGAGGVICLDTLREFGVPGANITMVFYIIL